MNSAMNEVKEKNFQLDQTSMNHSSQVKALEQAASHMNAELNSSQTQIKELQLQSAQQSEDFKKYKRQTIIKNKKLNDLIIQERESCQKIKAEGEALLAQRDS